MGTTPPTPWCADPTNDEPCVVRVCGRVRFSSPTACSPKFPGEATAPATRPTWPLLPMAATALWQAPTAASTVPLEGLHQPRSDFSRCLATTATLPQSGIGRARVDIAQTANEDGTHNAFAMYATSGVLFYGLYYSGGDGEAGSWEEVWPGEIQTDTAPVPKASTTWPSACRRAIRPWRTWAASRFGVQVPTSRLSKPQRHWTRQGSLTACTPTCTKSSSWTTTPRTAHVRGDGRWHLPF